MKQSTNTSCSRHKFELSTLSIPSCVYDERKEANIWKVQRKMKGIQAHTFYIERRMFTSVLD